MIDNWFEIDGRAYDVIVKEITESAEILYSENSGRTMSQGARMTLDPLGTFFNYKVTVKRHGENTAEYDRLFDYVTRPRYNGMHIKIVHNQDTIEFDAYISAAERTLSKIDEQKGKVYWKEMTLNIVAMEAQVLPR